jgi:hypothetical protein
MTPTSLQRSSRCGVLVSDYKEINASCGINILWQGYKWKWSDAPVDGYLRGDPGESLFQSHSLLHLHFPTSCSRPKQISHLRITWRFPDL